MESDDEGLCPICWERSTDTVLECQHAFCGRCITDLCTRKAICPLCRHVIVFHDVNVNVIRREVTVDGVNATDAAEGTQTIEAHIRGCCPIVAIVAVAMALILFMLLMFMANNKPRNEHQIHTPL